MAYLLFQDGNISEVFSVGNGPINLYSRQQDDRVVYMLRCTGATAQGMPFSPWGLAKGGDNPSLGLRPMQLSGEVYIVLSTQHFPDKA